MRKHKFRYGLSLMCAVPCLRGFGLIALITSMGKEVVSNGG